MLDFPHPMNLDELIESLDARSELSPIRRRDLRSAVRRMSKYLGRDPALLTASLTELRGPVAKLHAAQLGLALKTLQNLKSNFLAALSLAGPDPRSKRPLSLEWQALKARLPHRRHRDGLCRFLGYLSECGVAATEVTDGHVERFIAHLRTATLRTDHQVRDLHRRTTRLWNESRETIAEWPDVELAVPDYRKPRQSLPLSAFPDGFRKDAENYLTWATDSDPFIDDRPRKAIKPRTCKLRRKQIELAGSRRLRP